MGTSIGLAGDDYDEELQNIWEYAYDFLSLYSRIRVDKYARRNGLSKAEATRMYFRDDVENALEGKVTPGWYKAIEAKEEQEMIRLLRQVQPYNQIIEDALSANPESFDEEIRVLDEQRGFPNRPRRV